ncbi:MAG: ABC transporter permease [Eubacterium sp.]|nr:ABC transporter permease [Eubacterium sp.]
MSDKVRTDDVSDTQSFTDTDDGLTLDDFRFVTREENIEMDSVFSGDSLLRTAVKRFTKKKSNMFGLILLLLLIVFSIIGPYISGYGPYEQNLERINMAPDFSAHIFGTDSLGRDLFARCFQGLRISLLIALIATLINLIIGLNYGLVSGYKGGRVDTVMQRIVDVLSSIPTLVVVTLMMLILNPGVGAIIIALMVTGWMEMSIITRVQVLRIREREYILAARTLGAGERYIMFREILPNIIGPMTTQIMVSVPNAIYMETFLSFVGLGLPVGECSLGILISEGFKNTLMYPYQIIPPILINSHNGASDDRLQSGCRRT